MKRHDFFKYGIFRYHLGKPSISTWCYINVVNISTLRWSRKTRIDPYCLIKSYLSLRVVNERPSRSGMCRVKGSVFVVRIVFQVATKRQEEEVILDSSYIKKHSIHFTVVRCNILYFSEKQLMRQFFFNWSLFQPKLIKLSVTWFTLYIATKIPGQSEFQIIILWKTYRNSMLLFPAPNWYKHK